MQNLRELWWPLAFLDDLKCNHVLSLSIFGDPICVFVNAQGEIGVLADRCVHRGEPLSMGRVEGNNLQSHYHGWEYSCDGHVVRIPSIEDSECLAKGLQVYAYPIRKHCQRLWVWTGDAKNADSVDCPNIPCFNDESSSWKLMFTNTFDLDGVCPMLAMENQTDISHGPFVHHGTVATRSMAQVLKPQASKAKLSQVLSPDFDVQEAENVKYVLRDGTTIEHFQQFPFTQYMTNGQNGQLSVLNVIHIVPLGKYKARYLIANYSHKSSWLTTIVKVPGMTSMMTALYDKAMRQDETLLRKQTENVKSGVSSLSNAVPADVLSVKTKEYFKKALEKVNYPKLIKQDSQYNLLLDGCWFGGWESVPNKNEKIEISLEYDRITQKV